MKGLGGVLIVIGVIVGIVGSLLYGALIAILGVALLVLAGQKAGASDGGGAGEAILYQFKCTNCGTHGIIKFEMPAAGEFVMNDIDQIITQERTKHCNDCKTAFTAKAIFAHPLQRKAPIFEPPEAK
jgi:hypothetical protein